MLISIVIVNYNGRHFLGDCLDSIKAHVSCSHEVIVVDNASSDGSCDFLRTEYPWVRLVKSKVNTGFARGNNIGVARARGKYILLLNNDTVLCSSIQPMADIMVRLGKVGVLGCRLRYPDGRSQESIGYEHTPMRLACSWMGMKRFFSGESLFRQTVHNSSSIYSDHFAEVNWVSGACLMTSVALWRKLGGLDESYFMYVEEVDYCKRAWLSGYAVAYTGDVLVTHYEGGARPWIGRHALLNTMRSYRIYVRKFFGSRGLVLMSMLLSPILMLRACCYLLRSFFRINPCDVEKAGAYFRAARDLVMAEST